MKKHKLTLAKKIWRISLIFAFIVGLVLVWFLFNKQLRAIERNVEVTFVSPHQAIVFWKTNKPSLGYVKSGQKKYPRKTNIYQTSSEASHIHTVFLEEIPTTGLYLSIHNENDSPFYLPEIMHISYDPLDAELEP
jgi:hypothetical protein